MPRPTLKVRYYKDRKKQFRWSILRSGRVLADSGEGYSSRAKMLKTFTRLFASIAAESYTLNDETQPKKPVPKRAKSQRLAVAVPDSTTDGTSASC